ncbi:MAG TPA: SRPBCC domain-containing protein [Caulobacteraceae bacterium]|jgi:uncharacterized protein YndB with AHSA1/START domain|nr:SRPBCC domain-containing protein [Caulobacteraceae bacterium]
MTDPAQHHDSFTIERVYPNCRAHVWAAWARPEKKAAWFGKGEHRLDFRPGGAERNAMRDAMGEHVNETRYFELVDEARIVLAYSMALNGRVHTVSLATILFADEGGGTRLTYIEQICVIPPSDGMEGRRQGWTAILAQLAHYLVEDTAAAGASQS